MEKEFDNQNRGALFVNDRKTTERHPDYTGKINVEGVEYWLSAWVKDTRAGRILSLSLGERTDQGGKRGARELDAAPVRQDAPPAGQRSPSGGARDPDGMDDDIPFAPYLRGFAGFSV